MKLSLLVTAAMKPLAEALLQNTLHTPHWMILSDDFATARRQIHRAATEAHGTDALLLLEGYDLLPDFMWENGDVPLVVPKLHTLAGLLLGNEDKYRSLFLSYDGGLCWFLPSAHREYSPTPPDDCQALCHLTVTQLPGSDDTLRARAIAQYREWDYLEESCDLSLLESLLGGQWGNAYVFAPGETVCLHR